MHIVDKKHSFLSMRRFVVALFAPLHPTVDTELQLFCRRMQRKMNADGS